jgi:hypothetical protein
VQPIRFFTSPELEAFFSQYKLQAVKFWVPELRREEGASSSKACFTASFRSWEHVHTHTRFECSTRSAPGDATPHTFAFLVHGFWG